MAEAAATAATFASLPASVLRAILLSASSNLPLQLATVARVHPEWRRVAMTSGAYGSALDSPLPQWLARSSERTRVLRDVARALMQLADRGGKLILFGRAIGDRGGHVLAAALAALPSPLALVDVTLTGCGLGPGSASGISTALGRGFSGDGLRTLLLGNNPDLQDAGIVALAAVLPPTLRALSIRNTGCGSAGMVALAAALPPSLVTLSCSMNGDIAEPGWAALGAALARLRLTNFVADDCTNMRCAGAAAIAAGLLATGVQLRYTSNSILLQQNQIHLLCSVVVCLCVFYRELCLDSTGIGNDAIAALLPVIENFAQYSAPIAAKFGLSLAWNEFGPEARDLIIAAWGLRPHFALHT
jgi:hypothetical protein|eukprot:COSAG06_NODE_9_length_37879_cov_13.349735_8_plen_359_part_00